MALKQGFHHDDGATVAVETLNAISIDQAATAFASLPADVQTAVTAAALQARNDWHKCTVQLGDRVESYWISAATGAAGPAIVQ